MVASPRGGMNIEEVAQETPSEIYKEGVDIINGMQLFLAGDRLGRVWHGDVTECLSWKYSIEFSIANF